MSRFLRTSPFSRSISSSRCLLRQIPYDFSKIQGLISSTDKKGTNLIDVREIHEFEAGAIPTSLNVPLSTLQASLTLSDAAFKEKFGRSKPSVNDDVVFYCKSGVRSTKAAEIAESAGFKQVGNYKGSWTDWATKTKGEAQGTTPVKNPNLESGKGDGADGGIDLKAMNQKEEKRAQATKEKEGGKPLSGHNAEESESVKSGAELSGNKKFE